MIEERSPSKEQMGFMRLFVTGLMAVSAFFLFAEQNLLSPSLSAVAEEFGFSNHERDAKIGGHISAGFFLVGGVCGLFFGSLADDSTLTMPRTRLFSIVICIGEMGCIGTYFCTSFTELFICRVITGIAVGGSSPVCYKVLGELWGPSQRVRVSTLMGLSSSAGGAIGQITAGYIAPVYGWRTPFLVVAAPALLCAVALFFVPETSRPEEDALVYSRYKMVDLEEPGIGSVRVVEDVVVEAGHSSPTKIKGRAVYGKKELAVKPSPKEATAGAGALVEAGAGLAPWQQLLLVSPTALEEASAKLREVLESRTALLVYLQGIFGCIPWSILSVFMTDYLAFDLQMNIHRSSLVMLLFGVGATVGQVAGGFAGQVLFNKDPVYQVAMIATTCTLGSIPMLSIVNYEPRETHDLAFYAFFFCGGTLAAVAGPNIRSILQNVTRPENRGLAFALYTLADDVGRGGGPFLVSQLIMLFDNRRAAFTVGMLAWVVGGFLCAMMAYTYKVDVHTTAKYDTGAVNMK